MRASIILAIVFGYAIASFGQPPIVKMKENSKPFVLGVVDEIWSKELSEKRVLNIYLPEGYDANDTITYPVVYLLDGSVDEDFIHVVGLYQFNSFPWVNRVPKSIIVGIANTDRQRDFTYATTIPEDKKKFPTMGGSGKFIRFIEKELQPYIQQQYRTNGMRTIIGESLGGLLATEILLKKPQLFDKYIIISPSLWWDDGSLLLYSLYNMKNGVLRNTNVYIGVGKEGLGLSKKPHVMEVDANLLADKLKNAGIKNLTVYFDYLPEENHTTIAHQALMNALKLLNPTTAK